jgi:hypothetical protein
VAYNYTINRKKLVSLCEADTVNGKVNWRVLEPKLNDLFGENVSKYIWRRRYQRAKGHLASLEQKTIHTPEVIVGVSDEKKMKQEIVNLIKNQTRSAKELAIRFGITKYEAMGYITEIQNEGIFKIKVVPVDGDFRYSIDTSYVDTKEEYNHAVGKVKTYTFMVLSDSHMGSVNEQTSFLHYLYDYAQSRGIKSVYHCGDISEGYKQSRPDHLYSLHAVSFDEQLEHIVKTYPKRNGMTTYFITGNHDHFHIQNGGANIGKAIQAYRSDMKYLGINTAIIRFGENTRMELFHPQDGSSYATSYAGQKYLDSLNGGDKPNILFVGHHHKSIYFLYRNVHYFEVPSTHSQSDWEKGKRIQNTSGAWIVTIDVDEEGSVTRIVPESIIQFKHIKNDWQNWKELTK